MEGMKILARLTLAVFLGVVLTLIAIPLEPWMIVVVAGPIWAAGGAFILFFFRDANLHVVVEPGTIVSPAHGTVDYIDTTTETQVLNGPVRRISIYLSLLTVHVQHAPISGRVAPVQHCPGRLARAARRDASLRNEHLLVRLDRGDGRLLALRLIAGIWVRRIVPWIASGQRVLGGERIGLIRFGSRVDVFVPLDAQVSVKPGDKVRGGETVLARW